MEDAAHQKPTFPVEHYSLEQKNSNLRGVYHMAGYVAKKCAKKTRCDTCRALLLVPASEGRADTLFAFMSLRQGQIAPPVERVVRLCQLPRGYRHGLL